MMDKRDEMFTEEDIPDFSKLGAGNFSAAVDKLAYRIDHLASEAAKAALAMDDFERAYELRARLNAHSDYIAELMPDA